MKLQILIPQYNETENEIRELLDSIKVQQNIDFNDLSVIIANDGSDIKLDKNFLNSYKYEIKYYNKEHSGVSSTRNYLLDQSTADYVMFCDADDMFFNVCGLYLIFEEINKDTFDVMISSFMEETRYLSKPLYVTHQADTTFVHGKVYKRDFLVNNNIRWNDKLQIHEDSYFNTLAKVICNPSRVVINPNLYYLWKWRDSSVCRHDDKYMLKTFTNMLDSSDSLVKELISRGKENEAKEIACQMIYTSYYSLNKDEWINLNNKIYKEKVEKRFSKYYRDYSSLLNSLEKDKVFRIVSSIKNQMYREGLLMEHITFDDWISQIMKQYRD